MKLEKPWDHSTLQRRWCHLDDFSTTSSLYIAARAKVIYCKIWWYHVQVTSNISYKEEPIITGSLAGSRNSAVHNIRCLGYCLGIPIFSVLPGSGSLVPLQNTGIETERNCQCCCFPTGQPGSSECAHSSQTEQQGGSQVAHKAWDIQVQTACTVFSSKFST